MYTLALRQTCLVHLIRELEQTEKYKSSDGDWDAFSKKLRRLLGDAIRLWRRREEFDKTTYQSRRARLTQRLKELVGGDWSSGAHPQNSYGNRSEVGSDCQSVLKSVFRTLKQRGQDPIVTVVSAFREYLTTDKLPPSPLAKPLPTAEMLQVKLFFYL